MKVLLLRDHFSLHIQTHNLEWHCAVTNTKYPGPRGTLKVSAINRSTISLDSFYAQNLHLVPHSRGIMKKALCTFLQTIPKFYTFMILTASGRTPGGTLNDLVQYYQRSFGFQIDTAYGTVEEQFMNGLVEMIVPIKTMISYCDRLT